MEKLVVFGVGVIYQRCKQYLDMDDVVALLDNNADTIQKVAGNKVCHPKDISSLDYDYVVIMNQKAVQEIYEQLVSEYCVPKEKIMTWQHYVYVHRQAKIYSNKEFLVEALKICKENDWKYVCDYNLKFFDSGIWNKTALSELIDFDMHLTGYLVGKSDKWPIYHNLYDKCYTGGSFGENEYDVVFLLDSFLLLSIQEVIQLISKLLKQTKRIILSLPPQWHIYYTEWNKEIFEVQYVVKEIHSNQGHGLILSEKNQSDSKLKIYSVTHKVFEPVECLVRVPIHAGHINAMDLGYDGDDTGTHISELNPLINECTAMYWIWKNVQGQYVGLEHYRRVFINDEGMPVTSEEVLDIFKRKDIMVAKCYSVYPDTIKEQLKGTVSDEAFELGYGMIRERIRQIQPDYLDSFDKCMNGNFFYPCNLIVASKIIFDKYCEWLFSIIVDVAREIDVRAFDPYSKRIIGFLAERLLTVWLIKQEYRIEEMNYKLLEN